VHADLKFLMQFNGLAGEGEFGSLGGFGKNFRLFPVPS
jgi:hypothetical protein